MMFFSSPQVHVILLALVSGERWRQCSGSRVDTSFVLASGNAATTTAAMPTNTTTGPTVAPGCEGDFIVNSFRCFKVNDMHVCGMAGPTYKQTCENYTLVIQRAYYIAKASLDVQAGPANIGYALFDEKEADEFQVAARQAGFGDTELIHIMDFTAPTAAQLHTFVNFTQAEPKKSGLVAHCSGGMGRTGTFLTALVGKELFAEERPFDTWMQKSLQFVRDNYNCDACEFWDPAHIPAPYDGGLVRRDRAKETNKFIKMHEQKLSEFCLFWSSLVDGRQVSDCEGVDQTQLMRVLANEAIHCDAEKQVSMANVSVTKVVAALTKEMTAISSQDGVSHPLFSADSLGKVIAESDMQELALRFEDLQKLIMNVRKPIWMGGKVLMAEAHRKYVAAVLKEFGAGIHLDSTPKDNVKKAVDDTLREARSWVSMLESLQTAIQSLE